jgi:hypothetical protein
VWSGNRRQFWLGGLDGEHAVDPRLEQRVVIAVSIATIRNS